MLCSFVVVLKTQRSDHHQPNSDRWVQAVSDLQGRFALYISIEPMSEVFECCSVAEVVLNGYTSS